MQKNRFFGSKNVIFLRLLSQRAKTKCEKAAVYDYSAPTACLYFNVFICKSAFASCKSFCD